jgi:choline dehydrogenase-like flavoprotein
VLTSLRDGGVDGLPFADVVVIGGGAVGLSLGVALARAGKTVVLLEAGGRTANPQSQALFEEAAWQGYPLEGLHRGRVRALGGTTSLWAGQLAEFDPIVFEHRPWVADAGWPISSGELSDGYTDAMKLIGLSETLDDSEVWKRLRMELPPAGSDLSFFMTRWAPETNFARLYAEDIRSSRRLHVVTDAPVVGLAVDADGTTIRGVRARHSNGEMREVRGASFVLANGTVEIARLLSLATEGCSAPWAANRWLGRGFIDHIDAYAGAVTPIDHRRFHALFDSAFLRGLKYKPKMRLSEATQRRDELVGAVADFVFASDHNDELALLKNLGRGFLKRRPREALRAIAMNPRKAAQLLHLGAPMAARYLRHGRTYNPGDRGIRLRLSTEQKPLHESRLRLLDGHDAIGMPRVEVAWSIDGAEVEAMATLSKAVAGMLESSGIATIPLDPRLEARSRDFLSAIDDANHHMGMVRMAATPKAGVVDADLNVFGTKNLYVAGAAVFPTSGAANPTLTAIALAMRLARRLIDRT